MNYTIDNENFYYYYDFKVQNNKQTKELIRDVQQI